MITAVFIIRSIASIMAILNIIWVILAKQRLIFTINQKTDLHRASINFYTAYLLLSLTGTLAVLFFIAPDDLCQWPFFCKQYK